ncbi:MAG: response regulator [Leptospiraceae bacterium]|nr:response regulator [Leptospiraceae bacterium]
MAPNQQGMDACVVIIDDDENIRLLLKEMFIRSKYRVGSSQSAEAGFSMVSEMFPDLIISDISLPGMNGLDLLRKLKINQHLRLIPVIMLTAISEKTTVVQALRSGASDYFVKPFKTSQLLQRSHELIKETIAIKSNLHKTERPVAMLRQHGLTFFEIRQFPNRNTVEYFQTLLTASFRNQTRNDNFIVDIRPVSEGGEILQKFLQFLIKSFHPFKLRFLVGRHYALMMDLVRVEDMDQQLFLSVADLENSLGIKLPNLNQLQ